MNASRTFAIASLALLTATGAMAASPSAASQNAAPLTREAVIADLVASRQAASTQPRDGEWYNVPAPLGKAAHPVHTAKTKSVEHAGLDAQRK